MKILILGCGYVGRRVAMLAHRDGHCVHAMTRSPDRAAALSRYGLLPIVADVTAPDTLGNFPECDVLFYAVSPDRSAGADKRTVLVEGLANALRATAGRVRRVILLSSVSVYGQADGSWVDETSPTVPNGEGGRICLEAESVLQEFHQRTGTEQVRLRLAGIYGPDRILTRVESLQRGEPLPGRGDAWLNLIHADDAAAAAWRAARHPNPNPITVVVDDRPVQRQEYFAHLARLVNAPPPTFDDTLPSRHGHGLNKRCSNVQLRTSLGLSLQFPTFREGLANANSGGEAEQRGTADDTNLADVTRIPSGRLTN